MTHSRMFALALLVLMVLFVATVPALAIWQAQPTAPAPTATPASQPAPLGTELTWSAIAVFAIQWLKKNPRIAFIGQGKVKLLRALSALAAAASAVGIHATFSGGTLTVTNLSLAVVLPAGSAWLKQFVFQELIYRSAANGSAIPAPSGAKAAGQG